MDLHDCTILITCYNKKPFMDKFMSQFERMNGAGASIVIVDDGSVDGSTEILRNAITDYKNVKFLETQNFGSASARNSALKLATTKFVLFLDIDDQIDLSVLSDVIKNLLATNAAVGIANYKTSLVAKPVKMFTEVSEPTVFAMPRIKREIYEALGYWRFVYSLSMITNFGLEFIPTFAQLRGKRFILDDMYWLMQISASNIQISVMPSKFVLYEYFKEPEVTFIQWRDYLKQVELIPKANIVFMRKVRNNSNLDLKWIGKVSTEFLITHFKYLNFGGYLKALLPGIGAIFYSFSLTWSISHLIKGNGALLLTSIICIRNSAYKFKRKFKLRMSF
jgi:glycosyltransferase involved in cell wall biosynthesis